MRARGLVDLKELVGDWEKLESRTMSFEADPQVSAVACRGDCSSLISRRRRYRWRVCLRDLCLLGLSLVTFGFAAWAQQSFELSSRAEFETSFVECGESADQQYMYSDGPGVGGLPGRVETGAPHLKALFYRQPLVFEAARPVSVAVWFKHLQQGVREGDELVGIMVADATAYGWSWQTNVAFLYAALVGGGGGEARQLELAGHPRGPTGPPDSIREYSPEFSIADGWYQLAATWTLLGTNLFECSTILYSHGANGTGPTFEVSRHTIRASNVDLAGGKPVYIGVEGEPGDTPYLDNISIASGPSEPVLREVQIESLRKDGRLTWRSPVVPGYYGLECAEDVSGEWRPSAFWNVPLAGTENSVQIPLRPSSAPKLFFRLVCSQHELPLPRGAGAWEVRTDRGAVRGKVTFWEGDFMPPSTGTITPAKRPIFVFEKARMAQAIQSASGICFYSFVLSRFVDSTESGDDGYYEIALPPGDYSLLVLERSGDFYANEFGGNGEVVPVSVQANQTVAKDLRITYKASF